MSSTTVQLIHIFLAIIMLSALMSAIVTLSRQSNNFKICLLGINAIVWGTLGFYKMPSANIIEKRNIENVTVYYEDDSTSYEKPTQMDFTYKGERIGIFMEGTNISVGDYNDVEYIIRPGQTNEIQFVYTGVRNDILGVKPEVVIIIIYSPSTVKKILLNGGNKR
ncbi:MAG: hypothetical protein ACRCXX_04150 [Cetobacterium sp.]|uniref:hypothetical protein n=1 Tax=Cetobacterium sp. TaxID=2071632 RepID=UPI003F3AE295